MFILWKLFIRIFILSCSHRIINYFILKFPDFNFYPSIGHYLFLFINNVGTRIQTTCRLYERDVQTENRSQYVTEQYDCTSRWSVT